MNIGLGADVDRSRIGWALGGLGLAAIVGFVLYSFIGTFVMGLFIYYATRPVYNRLKRRVYPPSLAAAVAILLLALPALGLFAYVAAIAIQELQLFIQARGADLAGLPIADILGPYIDVSAIVQNPSAILEDPNLIEALRETVFAAYGYLGVVGNGLLHVFVMLALAFYLLRDGPRLSRWTRRQFGDENGVFDRYVKAVDQDLSSVFFGNILNAIITGVIGATAYGALNLFLEGPQIPYPYLLGLLTGVASLIPVVGMKLVYVPVTAYLAATTWPTGEGLAFVGIFAVVSFLIVDTTPDFVLRPYVSGRNLHVGTVMFAYIFGPLLFGWYGIFLGPLVLVLVIHFGRLIMPELLAQRSIRPYAVDPGALSPGDADGMSIGDDRDAQLGDD